MHGHGPELRCKGLSSRWTVFSVTRRSQDWTKSWLRKELQELSISARRGTMINSAHSRIWVLEQKSSYMKNVERIIRVPEASNNKNVKRRERQQSLHEYLQVQMRRNKDINPIQWGWRHSVNRHSVNSLVPTGINTPSGSPNILRMIFCSNTKVAWGICQFGCVLIFPQNWKFMDVW